MKTLAPKKKKPTASRTAKAVGSSRLVRLRRCGECGNLERDHIPDSSCWSEENAVVEKHRLPICVECGKTCWEDGDELCPTCWELGLKVVLRLSDA
jgi:hypothetical protein